MQAICNTPKNYLQSVAVHSGLHSVPGLTFGAKTVCCPKFQMRVPSRGGDYGVAGPESGFPSEDSDPHENKKGPWWKIVGPKYKFSCGLCWEVQDFKRNTSSWEGLNPQAFYHLTRCNCTGCSPCLSSGGHCFFILQAEWSESIYPRGQGKQKWNDEMNSVN